jgi:DNA polymerase-3 subunit gamma/tau
VLRRVAATEAIEIDDGALALVARHATGSFRDALGTLEQLVTYAGAQAIAPADVLAVLGVADAEQLFAALDAVVAGDPAQALRAATALAESGRDPGQVLRDLEVHGRELLTVQTLGEVPAELRVTAERDARLLAQAQSLAPTDAVRLLDLVSEALSATTDGAQPRIQLELVLIKAAAPAVDPSTSALLARIERLEQALARAGSVPAQPVVPVDPKPAPAAPEPAPAATKPALVEPTPERAEPEPEPVEPEPQAPTNGGPLDLPALLRLWPAVVGIVGGVNQMLAAALQGARPVELSEREATIAFPPGAAFLKRKAEQDDHRRIAADAVRKITGAALALRYEMRELQDEEGAADAGTTLSGEELVKRFLDEFNAEELLDDEPDEREAH